MDPMYWTSTLSRRTISRRRLLGSASAALGGAVALSLLGCSSSGSKSASDSSRLISSEKDTTKEAKPGGVYLDSYASEIANMDPLFIVGNIITHLTPVYGNLLNAGLSAAQKPGDEATTGDIAESWEVAPDAMRITLKLRPGQKFDPRPPTNGRLLEMSDVSWSWDKFVA